MNKNQMSLQNLNDSFWKKLEEEDTILIHYVNNMKRKQNDLLEVIMSNKAKEIQLLDKLNQDEINK